MRIRMRCLVIALAAATSANAGQINQVTGIVSHGSELTIVGTGFGAKKQAAPLVWDDFESRETGTSLDPGGALRVSRPDCAAAQTVRYLADSSDPQGSMVLRQQFTPFDAVCGTTGGSVRASGLPSGPLFMRGMYRVTVSGDLPSVVTPFALLAASDKEMQLSAWPATGRCTLSREACRTETAAAAYGEISKLHLTDAQWVTTSVSVRPDGSVIVEHEGQENLRSDPVVDSCDPGAPRTLELWRLASWFAGEAAAGSELVVDWSHVYVDTTLMRVEIGDRAEYGACTRRAVQPASSWQDDTIRIAANLAEFTAGETVHLFVVGEDGQPTAPSRALVVGTEGPGQPGQPYPGQPGQPMIVTQ